MTDEQKRQELDESNNLIEKGLDFRVPKKSLLKYFSKKKERTFVVKQPYLGALDMMGHEFLKLDLDDSEMEKDSFNHFKILTTTSADTLCNIIAIAVLGSRWKIRLFKRALSYYFKWRVTPSILIKLVIIILQLCNNRDFLNSIRFLRVVRTTSPQLIEEKGEDSKAPTE